MKITKNHVINTLFWILILAFMVVKSIDHTLNDHYNGVLAAVRDYKFQSQTRTNFIRSITFKMPVNNQFETMVVSMNQSLFTALDPIEYVTKSHELTQYIDLNRDYLRFAEKDIRQLDIFQTHLKQELLILSSHANEFNQLLSRFPYNLRASSYTIFDVPNADHIAGVVVER
ncbi:MAG: hypothetical protein ACON35_06300 [Candidatus Marinamargulisbacteria bacterium]